MTLSVYDIPVNGSFRILNVKDKKELFCSDPVYGDIPFDISCYVVVAVYAANDELIIEVEV